MKPYTIAITGASSGIGAALALELAQNNTHLILLGRNQKRLLSIQKKCIKQGAHCDYYCIDITALSLLRQQIKEIDQQSPIDCIIANAGITSSLGMNGEAESWHNIEKLITTNLLGAIACIEPLIQPMQQRKSGQIVLTSSLAAYRGMPITPAYSASKAGIKAYGEALRGWLRHDNIKVNIICPGFVKSNMSDNFLGNKPFIISTQKAANIIKKGLEKNKAIISFPFPLNLGTWLLSLLPAYIADPIMDKLSYGAKRSQ